MRVQDHIVGLIDRARRDAFRAARAMPEDRLRWRPLESGQSVLEICRELAQTPDWAYWILTDAKPDDPELAA